MEISSQYIQKYVTPIVTCAMILEELKQKRQAILALQHDNAVTKKEKSQ